MVETGIVIGLPEGTNGRLAATRDMPSTMGIKVDSGVIHAEYTREAKVILKNHGQADCLFKEGDRIAQLIVESIADTDAMELADLGTTERGKNGCG